MSDPMSLTVDKKVVEQVIMSKIAAEVAASFDSIKDEMVNRLVKDVLTKKVETSSGNYTNSDYNSEPFINYMIRGELKKLTQEILKEFMEKNKAGLKKRLEKSMKDNQDKFISTFMGAMESQLSSDWSVKVDVELKDKKRY